MRRSAMAASAGSPPASWKAWRRVDIPAYGYGIRYVNGMFRQEIHDGWQVELPETWLDHGNPWEFERRERSFEVGFGGSVESVTVEGRAGSSATSGSRPSVCWPSPTTRRWSAGAATRVNTLRLWSGMPIDPILLDAFNAGDHIGALAESNKADALSRVLYPADSTPAGQELRLRQEYFFSTASLQDIVAAPSQPVSATLHSLPDKAAIQLNDTHPAIAVAELMRLLMDVHGIDFDEAWDITKRHLRLHQPHAAARGAGKLAGAAVRAACCRATCRSSTPSTPRCCSRRARPASFYGRADRAHLADRGEWRAPRAHGQSGLCRLAHRSTASRRCIPS